MNFIKELLADALNGFVLSDIPFMIFRLFMAGVLAYLMHQLFIRKSTDEEEKNASRLFPAIAMIFAVLSMAVEFSQPLAILSLPVVLLMYPRHKDFGQFYQFFLVLTVGSSILCGSGNIFLAILGLIFILPLIFYYKN